MGNKGIFKNEPDVWCDAAHLYPEWVYFHSFIRSFNQTFILLFFGVFINWNVPDTALITSYPWYHRIPKDLFSNPQLRQEKKWESTRSNNFTKVKQPASSGAGIWTQGQPLTTRMLSIIIDMCCLPHQRWLKCAQPRVIEQMEINFSCNNDRNHNNGLLSVEPT